MCKLLETEGVKSIRPRHNDTCNRIPNSNKLNCWPPRRNNARELGRLVIPSQWVSVLTLVAAVHNLDVTLVQYERDPRYIGLDDATMVVGTSPAATAPKTTEHKPAEYVDMTPIEASQEEDARRGGFMVVTAPAKTSAELEERERRMRACPIDVEFIESEDSVESGVATGGN
jgi:hypothetical protein